MPVQHNINEDIKTMLELTVRLDEKLASIKEVQQNAMIKINELNKFFAAIDSRVAVIESKNGGKHHELLALIHALDKREAQTDMQIRIELESIKSNIEIIEKEKTSWVNMIGKFIGLIVQAGWVIVVCYLLFKLGLNTPPLP